MPVVMREKMEGAFGMDLSGVKLYETKAVGKAKAEAVTQGSRIAFAPGMSDFSACAVRRCWDLSSIMSLPRQEARSGEAVW